MQLPNNRMIVNKIDLTDYFKMVLMDGYELSVPQPKTNYIDIPGASRKLDLSEYLIGDVTYDNRQDKFEFIINNVSDFYNLKSELITMLHGKSYDYILSMDPNYVYHGRISLDSITRTAFPTGEVMRISMSIDGDPYKHKPDMIYKIDAIGGILINLPSGRQQVKPTIEVSSKTRIIFNNKVIDIDKGAYELTDVLFKQGTNAIYFNSYNIKNLTWGSIFTNNVTWGMFKEKHLFEWYKSQGDGTLVMKKWSDVVNDKWSQYSATQWSDLMYEAEKTDKIENVYIKYKWGDL